MHQRRRAHDLPAVGLPYRLMAEADAEDWDCSVRPTDQVEADAGLIGGAWAGREDDRLGRAVERVVNRDLVVSDNDRLCSKLAEIMDEIEGKADANLRRGFVTR
jgi:hypothetical protein